MYENYGGIIMMVLILVSVLVLGIHYMRKGSKGVPLDDSNNVIERFTRFERILHFIRAFTFAILAISGLVFMFIEANKASGMMHSITGIIFFIVTIITLVWIKSYTFKPYDKLWLRHLGGYLSKESDSLPAGKYNAGQKVFFWMTILFTLILTGTGKFLMGNTVNGTEPSGMLLLVHGCAAALSIISIVGHIYLSIWANKGTWRVLKSGKVSEKWVQSHHPNWEIDKVKSKAPKGHI